ncbi:SRPBCC family protein [Pseudomonas sp. TKO26]|uniref:SRPBCC family protein n=1 Tax=unclassified Pseudomonas TaxID=196821 RepID=UPI000D87CDCE|nr:MULTISPECIES: SRPBCC family protein [unclassified Pseudomonas]PYY78471.1 SRPBCC family protein [Pseudomonas sp. TKO30]PYY79284.1 SRPBCC family protein [Pseudomonas sp. TKO29]PYY81152.1 SRPBCC family protein [Pseudomonas sp. TKO26]PYY96088.1 SRPBCC family protein [Pseudomonas sp. TKO14]
MGQRQSHLLQEQIRHELYIRAGIDTVYYYLSQPDRWPEWHPCSLRADTGLGGSLPAGHRFSETMNLLGVQIPTSYRVLVALFPKEFKVLFSSAALDGSIRYQLSKQGDGTLLQRTLAFSTDLHLSGLGPRMEQLSAQALGNLKQRLEATAG